MKLPEVTPAFLQCQSPVDRDAVITSTVRHQPGGVPVFQQKFYLFYDVIHKEYPTISGSGNRKNIDIGL